MKALYQRVVQMILETTPWATSGHHPRTPQRQHNTHRPTAPRPPTQNETHKAH